MKPTDKILITGSTGMLGRAIVDNLSRLGFNNLITPSSQQLDLRNSAHVARYLLEKQPLYIFHLASLVYGLKGNQNNQLKSLIDNTLIYANLLGAVNEVPSIKKIFFAGTVASYAYPFKHFPLEESNFFDGLPHSGEFGYAMAKRHAYSYLKLLEEKNQVDYVYGLYTNLYGPHDRFDTLNGHVIPSLIAKAFTAKSAGRSHFMVWGNPESSRDFMYVDDAARASILLMQEANGIANICTGVSTSMRSAAEAISSTIGKTVQPIWDANEPVGIVNREISATRLKSLGFIPKYSIETGIAHTMEWYSKKQRERDE